MTTEPEPGPHGEPWESAESQPMTGTGPAYLIEAHGPDGLLPIATFYYGDPDRAWSILCVNALHKAGVAKPEKLPAAFRTLYRIIQAPHMGCQELRCEIGRVLAALEGKDDG